MFPITYSVGETLEGYKTLKKLASSRHHIVPGHDPEVLKIYPAAAEEAAGSMTKAGSCGWTVWTPEASDSASPHAGRSVYASPNSANASL